MNAEELKVVLEKHAMWLNDLTTGERADLRNANLRNADLRNANLRCANLLGANLLGADLRNANLRNADLRNADLRYANLLGADLRNADLWGADLWGANLRNATGNMREVKSLQLETYAIAYTEDMLQIGCENHTIEEWRELSDERILQMDGRTALKFWRKWKETIFTIIEMSPAEETSHERL